MENEFMRHVTAVENVRDTAKAARTMGEPIYTREDVERLVEAAKWGMAHIVPGPPGDKPRKVVREALKPFQEQT